MTAQYFEGENGERRISQPIPTALIEPAQAAREQLLDRLSLLSETMTEQLLNGEEIPKQLIWDTVRKGVLSRVFTPVLMGSALKNKGVQNLLDAIALYLPSPQEREAVAATDIAIGGTVTVDREPTAPVVALAFKLIDDEFGQLTYTRLYAGTLHRGDRLYNSRTQQLVRVKHLVRIEVDERQELESAATGEIVGLVGVDCASGDTLCSPGTQLSLEGMVVPDPVMTVAIAPKSQKDTHLMAKALQRFTREDPTLQVSRDPESGKTLLSGMGELHLDIYLERLRREYRAGVYVGEPAVAYRETITQPASFDYTLQRETKASKQYAQVVGRLELCPEPFQFDSEVTREVIPPQFVAACEQGFRDALTAGGLKGYPVVGVRVVLTGGAFHPTESSEMAFRFAAMRGFETGFARARPTILEPMMLLEVETPNEFVGPIQAKLVSRRALLLGSETRDADVAIQAEVPLAEMFGYATELRSLSHGMATFSLEFADYRPLPETLVSELRYA
jgi:elongation factor G